MWRYPGRDSAGDDQGVGAHKDGGFLTLLLQDENRGLQVETDDGWVDVTPKRGTLVVNIGELLELASNGYLRATVHRVVTPPAGTERLSVPFFLLGAARCDDPAADPAAPALAAEARGPASDPENAAVPRGRRQRAEEPAAFAPGPWRSAHYADLLEKLPG